MLERYTNNIQSLRSAAIFLLVSFHVIGPSALDGMRVSDSSVWRLASDLLVDVRMPLFAFIAGVVYSIRPISLSNLGGFVIGKLHRLYIPGVIAASIFLVLGILFFDDAFSSDGSVFDVLALSSGHFWFLQAILIILIVVGILDALLNYRAASILFLLSALLMLNWSKLHVPSSSMFKLGHAVSLAPFFLLGIVVFRNAEKIFRRKYLIAAFAACLFVYGLQLNLDILSQTDRFSQSRWDTQSLAFGVGVIILAYLFFPSLPLLDRLGIYTFAIYLYHPLGTSAARRVFDAYDYYGHELRFIMGVMAGFSIPILIHILSANYEWTRRVVLGLRRPPSWKMRPV